MKNRKKKNLFCLNRVALYVVVALNGAVTFNANAQGVKVQKVKLTETQKESFNELAELGEVDGILNKKELDKDFELTSEKPNKAFDKQIEEGIKSSQSSFEGMQKEMDNDPTRGIFCFAGMAMGNSPSECKKPLTTYMLKLVTPQFYGNLFDWIGNSPLTNPTKSTNRATGVHDNVLTENFQQGLDKQGIKVDLSQKMEKFILDMSKDEFLDPGKRYSQNLWFNRQTQNNITQQQQMIMVDRIANTDKDFVWNYKGGRYYKQISTPTLQNERKQGFDEFRTPEQISYPFVYAYSDLLAKLVDGSINREELETLQKHYKEKGIPQINVSDDNYLLTGQGNFYTDATPFAKWLGEYLRIAHTENPIPFNLVDANKRLANETPSETEEIYACNTDSEDDKNLNNILEFSTLPLIDVCTDFDLVKDFDENGYHQIKVECHDYATLTRPRSRIVTELPKNCVIEPYLNPMYIPPKYDNQKCSGEWVESFEFLTTDKEKNCWIENPNKKEFLYKQKQHLIQFTAQAMLFNYSFSKFKDEQKEAHRQQLWQRFIQYGIYNLSSPLHGYTLNPKTQTLELKKTPILHYPKGTTIADLSQNKVKAESIFTPYLLSLGGVYGKDESGFIDFINKGLKNKEITFNPLKDKKLIDLHITKEEWQSLEKTLLLYGLTVDELTNSVELNLEKAREEMK